MDVIFIDKDGTLGSFHPDSDGMYENVPLFLVGQKKQGRGLYIATTAGAQGITHLADVEDLLDGYFGKEDIASVALSQYVLPDGSLRNINDDFAYRIDFVSEDESKRLDAESWERSDRLHELSHGTEERDALQREINEFFDHWHGRVHKETQEPFDKSTRYQNPNNKPGFGKDLYLARMLISPENPEAIRAVMVGDHGDLSTPASNPETPLVVVSGNVRSGQWNLVDAVVDTLFSQDGTQTWECFEKLYSAATQDSDSRIISLNGVEYQIEKGEHRERIIYCP